MGVLNHFVAFQVFDQVILVYVCVPLRSISHKAIWWVGSMDRLYWRVQSWSSCMLPHWCGNTRAQIKMYRSLQLIRSYPVWERPGYSCLHGSWWQQLQLIQPDPLNYIPYMTKKKSLENKMRAKCVKLKSE